MISFSKKFQSILAIIVGVLVLVGVAYGAYYTYGDLENKNAEILAQLDIEREVNYGLLLSLRGKQEIIDNFQGQISNISSTVGDLTKLAATDEELLKKYSKVYFLNENYIPSKLTSVDEDLRLKGATNFQIHTDVWPHLEDLLDESREDDIELLVASAFRSFDTQSSLKANYKVIYGSGANQFSADQGYSEHQLGTALDFSSPLSGTALLQATDPGYKWLLDNAHDFGFILSYPANNAYYKFEPWHWRYVGRELASRLHDENKSFYDLDQRVIDTYLIKLFD